MKHLLAASFLLASASPAFTQQPAAAATQPAHWQVDGSGPRCVLARRLEGAPAATLFVRVFPGTGNYELMLASRDWPQGSWRLKKDASIMLRPADVQYDGSAKIIRLEHDLGDALVFSNLPGDFLDHFGKASSIAIGSAGKPVAAYTLPAAAKAAEALRFCEIEKLVEWGADRAGFGPGATQPSPVGDRSQWLTVHDLGRVGELGSYTSAVVARLTIGADGRVEQCELLEAYATQRLAGIACRTLSDRARYQPARDKDGTPVRSVAIYRASWSVETEIRINY